MPRAHEVEQQLSRLALSGCQLSADIRVLRARLPEVTTTDPPKLLLKFEVARQASSPSLCASVRAVPWADEAELKLSRLVPYGCQLSADVRIFGAWLLDAHGTDPLCYVGSLR